MKAHCLFEQSGTFKNEFKKLGYEAFDYDIQNEFGQTDYVVDLFSQIRGGYEGKPSIFDNIEKDDLILAFFPCTRFEAQILLSFRAEQYQDGKMTDIEKLERDLRLHKELTTNYELITKLAIIVLRKGLKMVFENPYTTQHYLTRYWAIKPKVIDKDRRERGDYFAKPTQYWFFNFEPKNNFIFEIVNDNSLDSLWGKKSEFRKTGADSMTTARSMIHPDYANRFIREHLIDYNPSFDWASEVGK